MAMHNASGVHALMNRKRYSLTDIISFRVFGVVLEALREHSDARYPDDDHRCDNPDDFDIVHGFNFHVVWRFRIGRRRGLVC